jgi:hypothetical protein
MPVSKREKFKLGHYRILFHPPSGSWTKRLCREWMMKVAPLTSP